LDRLRAAPGAENLRNKKIQNTTKGVVHIMKKFLALLAVVAIVAFAAPAFAANPFMDVPAGHWSYDAVAQLASKGLVSGYPDGAFKGGQPATRYEVASMVARALAYEDLRHASKEDLEMLKKLVMEFKDELDALGVKVDKIDKRVAVLEDRLGGWKLRGIFRFDAKFGTGDNDHANTWTRGKGKNEFSKENFRLFLSKQIDEKTYFETQYRAGAWASGQKKDYKGRGEANEMSWNKVFVNTVLPYDVNFRFGRFQFDWEGDHGLYTDEDAAFGDWRADGFELTKKWGNFRGVAVIGRNTSGEGRNEAFSAANESFQSMLYAAKFDWKPTDKFWIAGMGYWQQGDGENTDDLRVNTYGAAAGFKFTPAVELKGIYYWQTYSGWDAIKNGDNSKSWKAILDVKQDALKFTSLWVEYAQEDNWFGGNNDQGWVAKYSLGTYLETGVLNVRPHNDRTTTYWHVQAKQKWNKKFGTFARYTRADWDTLGQDNATEWGAGVTYQYSPAIAFMLAYDSVDYGNGGKVEGKDNLVIFRTTVRF